MRQGSLSPCCIVAWVVSSAGATNHSSPLSPRRIAADGHAPGGSEQAACREEAAEAIALLQTVIESSGNDLVALKGAAASAARHLAHAALARTRRGSLALYRRKVDPQREVAGTGRAIQGRRPTPQSGR